MADAKRKEGDGEAEVMKQKHLRKQKERKRWQKHPVKRKLGRWRSWTALAKNYEFKILVQKDKDIALAQINIQKDVAVAQADVLAEHWNPIT